MHKIVIDGVDEKHYPMIYKASLEVLIQHIHEMEEIIMDLLSQACGIGTDDKFLYDHMCLSAYENALSFAIKHGLIKEKDLARPL